MEKSVIITLPDHDIETTYVSKWSEAITTEGKRCGLKVVQLISKRASRDVIEGIVASKGIDLFIVNGHGDEDAIYGYGDKALIDGRNISKFKGIIYTIACEAAKSLGKAAVSKNTKCFIGYTEKFVIIYDHTKTVTPLKDELSRPFFDSTNRIPLSIMKGNSCAESVERAKKAYDEWIVKVRSLVIDEHLPEQEWLLRALIWDSVSLKLLGNGDSTI
ncbi:MAG: hypothetical protein M1354_02650 [Candidatus Marsarchaeota archaeon]|jgi:hypothetical protein|nr:hypothetical protein [Candidatus Marsarchaeota archaeon]